MALTEQQNPWRAIVEGSDYSLSSQEWEDLLTELDANYAALPASEQKPAAWDQDAAIEAIEEFAPGSSLQREMIEQVAFDPTRGPVYMLTTQGRVLLDQLNSAFFCTNSPDSAARIKELEDRVNYWIADRNELQQKDDAVIAEHADRIRELEAENARLRTIIDEEAKDSGLVIIERDAIKEKLRVAREAINYCVKQVPELATVPGMAEAIATI